MRLVVVGEYFLIVGLFVGLAFFPSVGKNVGLVVGAICFFAIFGCHQRVKFCHDAHDDQPLLRKYVMQRGKH